jgi:hypothetical protein
VGTRAPRGFAADKHYLAHQISYLHRARTRGRSTGRQHGLSGPDNARAAALAACARDGLEVVRPAMSRCNRQWLLLRQEQWARRQPRQRSVVQRRRVLRPRRRGRRRAAGTRSAAARMHETHLRCTTEVASYTSDALTAQGTSPWSSRQMYLHPIQRPRCTSTRRRHCSATPHHRAQRGHQRCDRTSSKVLSLTWHSQDSLQRRNGLGDADAGTASNRPAIPL